MSSATRVAIGEWWLPSSPERRVKGALIQSDEVVLKLFEPLVASERDEINFVPALRGVCDELGNVLLLDCWLERSGMLAHLAEYASHRARAQTLLHGQIADDSAHPKFAVARYEVEGLLGWIDPGGAHWDAQLSEDKEHIWTYKGQPPIQVFEDEAVRMTVYVGLSASDDSFDAARQHFRESAILEVASKRGRVELSELQAACTKFVRLLELMLYRRSRVTLRNLYYTLEDGDSGLRAHSCREETEDSPQWRGLPAIAKQHVAPAFDAICAKWDAAFTRNPLPYHRLAASLSHSTRDPLEQRFSNICAAIAAWVEHGGGAGSSAIDHQIREVLSIAEKTFGTGIAAMPVQVVKNARHFLAHGDPKRRPQQMHQGSWFLWGWTRRLTACLWVAVINQLGVPAEVIRGASSRSATLRYDAFQVPLKAR